MYTIKLWSAGHKIDQLTKVSEEEIEQKLTEIRQKLNAGIYTFPTKVSSDIPVTVLCVDVIMDGEIVEEINLNATK